MARRFIILFTILSCIGLHANAEEFPIHFKLPNKANAYLRKKLTFPKGATIQKIDNRESVANEKPGVIAATSFLIWGHGFKITCSAEAKEPESYLYLKIYYRDNGVWKYLKKIANTKVIPQNKYCEVDFFQNHNELQNRNFRHKIEICSNRGNVAISDIIIDKWPVANVLDRCNIPDGIKIVLPGNVTDMEKKAVKELKHYIEKRVKAFQVGNSKDVTFYIGKTDYALKNNIDFEKLIKDGYIIKTIGNNVIIVGGGYAGTLFGVYRFIEDQLGVRWWTPMSEYIPEPGIVELDNIDLKYEPYFDYRNIYWMRNFDYPQEESKLFFSRIRLSTPLPFGSPGTCHTFDRYLPAQRYMKEHPEYFSLINGKRAGGPKKGQVCLTNPEVRKLFVEKLKEYLDKDNKRAEKSGLPAPYIYDISQNDNNNFCTCEKCMAIKRKEGSFSGPLIDFINSISDGIKELRPDIYIQTFAYMLTEKPPQTIKLRDNVIITLTNISHNLAVSPDKNKIFLANLKKWSSIASRLHIWDYSTTYGDYSIPTPTEFRYDKTFKIYYKYKVKGIFWEHEFQARGDMYELKLFLERKYLENPQYDFNKLLNDFMAKYYGDAGHYLIKYRKALYEAAKRNKLVMSWNTMSSSYIDLDTALKCWNYCNKALKSVSNDRIKLNRVRKAVIGFYKIFLFNQLSNYITQWTKSGKLQNSFPVNIKQARKEYIRMAKQIGLLTDKDSVMLELPSIIPEPDLFKGKQYTEFRAPDIPFSCPATNLAVDNESECKVALRFDADHPDRGKGYGLPQSLGVYNNSLKKQLSLKKITKAMIPGSGYHWYELKNVNTKNNSSILFLLNYWGATVSLANLNARGKHIDIYVHIKFEGPRYYPNSKHQKNAIFIDRVIVTPSR